MVWVLDTACTQLHPPYWRGHFEHYFPGIQFLPRPTVIPNRACIWSSNVVFTVASSCYTNQFSPPLSLSPSPSLCLCSPKIFCGFASGRLSFVSPPQDRTRRAPSKKRLAPDGCQRRGSAHERRSSSHCRRSFFQRRILAKVGCASGCRVDTKVAPISSPTLCERTTEVSLRVLLSRIVSEMAQIGAWRGCVLSRAQLK